MKTILPQAETAQTTPVTNEGLLENSTTAQQYHKVKGERFGVYCDSPIQNFKSNNYKSAFFKTLGPAQSMCRMQIVSESKLKHADFVVSTKSENNETTYKPVAINDKTMEYLIPGDATIKIKWK